MGKPTAYIQKHVSFLKSDPTIPFPEEKITQQHIDDDLLETKLIPHEVEILYWGNIPLYTEQGTIPVTVAFCRDIITGECIEVAPKYLSFDKD